MARDDRGQADEDRPPAAGLHRIARARLHRHGRTLNVLISVEELAAQLETAEGEETRSPRLLDIRWKLGGPPGISDYRAGHIPGAVFADLDQDLAAPAAEGRGRHPLPAIGDLQDSARRWGLRTGEPVVVYDDTGGMAAARAWWVLSWAGVDDVRLLDGGLSAWRSAGHPADRGDVDPPAGDVVLSEGQLPVLHADDVAAFVRDGGLLLDARAAERYRGEPNPIDPQFGHIPGAVSAPTTQNLAPDSTFRSAADLAAAFAALGAEPGRPVAVYCGSGVTAAHEIAALAEAGVEGVALYPGSWSQWAVQPGRPIATGPEPGPPA